MSWEQAKKDAQRWVDGLNLPTKKMRGETIDLTEQAKTLKHEPHYRAMVLDAAKRLLHKRGVTARISE
jgi:hypothetical protein